MRGRHLILTGVALATFAVAPVRADCAVPYLSIAGEPSSLRVGDTFTIRGEGGWGDFGCDDTGGGSIFGCSGDRGDEEASGEPHQDIEIRLIGPLSPRQERRVDRTGHHPNDAARVVLSTVDADEDGYFEVELEVPDVEPGRYAIDTPLNYDDVVLVQIREG